MKGLHECKTTLSKD